METFQAAAGNADFSKVKDFFLMLTDQPGAKSWPITAATYMLLRKDSPPQQNHDVLAFLPLGADERPAAGQGTRLRSAARQHGQADRDALEHAAARRLEGLD